MQRIIQNSNKRLKDWEARQKNKSGSSQCPSRRKNCNSLQQDDAPGLEKKEASDADDASGLMRSIEKVSSSPEQGNWK